MNEFTVTKNYSGLPTDKLSWATGQNIGSDPPKYISKNTTIPCLFLCVKHVTLTHIHICQDELHPSKQFSLLI